VTVSKALLNVLSGRTPERRPIWLMRQAGRYLPEYRQVREQAGSFLELCYRPDLAAEVTLQPLRRYDLDASIVFADILVVPHALGSELKFVENEGPVLSVVRDMAGVLALGDGVGAWQFGRVYETLGRVKAELPAGVTLIGFCGAPWTVASYMVEGRGSDRALAIAAAREGAPWFVALVERLVQASVSYLVGQVRAGAEVVQIFDSWAGDLPEELRARWVHRPIADVVAGLRKECPDVPVIVFGRGIGTGHAALAAATAANAVSVEQNVALADVLRTLPATVAVQGNLAPEVLLSGGTGMVEAVGGICRSVPMARHIFNLGHGIMQHTPPENVRVLVDTIRRHDGDVV
jgi:uroporphyrinogen decarboxylase